MNSQFRHHADRLIHRGHIWSLVEASFEAPDGEPFEREVVRSPGAVAAVPIVGGDADPASVVLVAQYRPAHDQVIIEIPAGMRDVEGEPKTTTAQRELAEEVGLAADHLDLLSEMIPSPGMSDAVTTIYLATGCRPVERAPHGVEEHHAEVLTVPLHEAIEWIEQGRIVDSKTVVGLLLAERRLRVGLPP